MVRGNAMISEAPHALGQIGIIRNNHTSLASGNMLDGVEAEGCQVRKGPYLLALIFRPESMAAIRHECKVVSTRKPF